jgi:mono/diheme cytochrome c family protein
MVAMVLASKVRAFAPSTCVLVALCLCLPQLSACSGRVAPTREWQPADHGQPVDPDPGRTPAAEEPEEGGPERAADALFSVSCASCHGRDGRGQGEQRPPGAQLPDFTDRGFQAQRTDEQLSAVIRDGRGMMPAYGKQLNDQGLTALLGRIRRFAAPAPAPANDNPAGAKLQ